MTGLHFLGAVLAYAARTAMALCMPDMSKEFGWNKTQQVGIPLQYS